MSETKMPQMITDPKEALNKLYPYKKHTVKFWDGYNNEVFEEVTARTCQIAPCNEGLFVCTFYELAINPFQPESMNQTPVRVIGRCADLLVTDLDAATDARN